MSDYLERTKNGTSFAGGDVDIYRAALLASSLRLYAKTGMRPTRTVGPMHMLKEATKYTGKKYKKGDYEKAAADLDSHVEFLKRSPNDTKHGLPAFPVEGK